MITEELLTYIRGQIKTSRSDNDIKNDLLNNNWQEADIDEAFLKIRPLKGLYSAGDIMLGGFIGGTFVAGYLAGENEKELGNPQRGNLFKALGVILTIIFFLLNAYMRTLHPGSNAPNTGILNSSLGILLGVLQQNKIKEYIKQGKKIRHGWPIICIIVTILIWTIGILGIIASTTH